MKSRTTSPFLPEEADILSELSYKINSGALNKGCIHQMQQMKWPRLIMPWPFFAIAGYVS
jgi:hypothetical protein